MTFFYVTGIRLLDSLGDDMEGSSSLLGGSLSRVRLMMNSGRGNRQLMCYVSIGVVFGLFMLYLMMRKLLSGSSSAAPAPSL